MIKSLLLTAFAAFMLIGAAPSAHAEAIVGQAAPDFTGTDTNGVEHKLSDLKGKTVVLEWSNDGCPFVHKHYDSGNMQKTQEKATADGVVWLTIVSSAEGKQGFMTPEEANAYIEEMGAKATARILDPSGEIGELYGAKTTPHMFVIDDAGMLVYAGAIDSDSSPKESAIEGATNYVDEALAALKEGKPIKVASSQPYGCAVKY